MVALLKRLEGHSGFPTEATSFVAVSPSTLWLTQTEQGWKQPRPSFYRQAIHFPLAAKTLWSVVSNGWTWASSYSTPQRRRGPHLPHGLFFLQWFSLLKASLPPTQLSVQVTGVRPQAASPSCSVSSPALNPVSSPSSLHHHPQGPSHHCPLSDGPATVTF